MAKKQPIVVDDEDVNVWVDLIRRHADFSIMSAASHLQAKPRLVP